MKWLSWTPVFIALTAMILLAVFMWYTGNRQLAGFDGSALIDTAWRLAIGQMPYKDFYLTTPPAFYLGAGYAYQIWGIKWSSFVLAAIWFTELIFISQAFLLSKIVPWKYGLAIAFTCQMLSMGVLSFWWYNGITMSAACLFLTSAYVFARYPETKLGQIALWGSLTLFGLTKPNIAGILSLLVFGIYILFPRHRFRALVIGGLSVVSALILLWLFKIPMEDLIKAYVEMAQSRGKMDVSLFFFDRPYEAFVTIPLIFLCLCLLPVTTILSSCRKRSPGKQEFLLFTLITIASFAGEAVSLFTNVETNLTTGIPLILLSSSIMVFFLLQDPQQLVHPGRNKVAAFVCGILAMVLGMVVYQQYYLDKVSIPSLVLPVLVAVWLVIIVIGISSLAIDLIYKRFDPVLFRKHPVSHQGLIVVFLVTCNLAAMIAGLQRWRLLYPGREEFFTTTSLTTIANLPWFEHYVVSSRLDAVMQEMKSILETYYGPSSGWKNIPVFMGPRLEFSYSVFGISPPVNLPVWWHLGFSYIPAQMDQTISGFQSHSFKLCFLLRDPDSHGREYLFLPPGILHELEMNYQRQEYNNLVVYVRR